MLIYVAAPYPARKYVEELTVTLGELGHECTSTWVQGTREIRSGTVGPSMDTDYSVLVHHVLADLADIRRSDLLLSLTASYLLPWLPSVSPSWLHTGGRHVELGFALALAKPVIVVGEPENVFQRGLCLTASDMKEAIFLLSNPDVIYNREKASS